MLTTAFSVCKNVRYDKTSLLESTPAFCNRWPILKAQFLLEDIFNCDEIGLFWRALHDKGYLVGTAKLTGGKGEDEITILEMRLSN